VNVTAKAAKGVATVIKADDAVTAAAVAGAPKAEIAPGVTPRAPKVKTPAANPAARAAVKVAANIAAVAKAIAAAVAIVAVAAVTVANVALAVIAAVPIPAPKASKAAARSDRVSR